MLTNQYLQRTPQQITILHSEQQVDFEDRGSVIIENDDSEILDSANSGGPNDDGFEDFTRNGMFKIGEGSNEFNTIVKIFHAGMGRQGKETKIVAVHRNSVSSLAGKGRWLSFRIFSQAVAEKSGGKANLRFGWYGASREEICQVISHGFSLCGETTSGESHGIGISLTPVKFSSDGVASAIVDENGIRHMLLCRVIMGKMEAIPAGSKQFQPSSAEFDSCVDNVEEPRKFTVWSAFMNSHIFPNYIVSFKAPYFNGLRRNLVRPVRPSSPWMSFPALLSILKKYVEPSKMALIFKSHDEFKNNKITRLQLIRRVRQISGDKLLVDIIKSCKDKSLCSKHLTVAAKN